MKNIQQELQYIVETIVETTNTNQIYLFGSYAYGTPTEDSDIDLCVVTEDKDRKIDIIKKIRKALRNNVKLPIDILVYYKDEFVQRASLNCTMEYQIAYEGVSIYDK